MDSQEKTLTEEVKTLNERAARLAQEAEKAAQEAKIAAQQAANAAQNTAKNSENPLIPEAEYASEQGHHISGGVAYDSRAEVKPVGTIEEDLADLVQLLNRIIKHLNNVSLSSSERARLLGSGVRRLGFIEKVTDTAQENPQFIPAFFDLAEMQRMARLIEILRTIRTTSQTIDRVANDALLVTGHDSFQLALMYYNTVKEMARRNIIGAQEIFKMLELFFRRGRVTDVEEATPFTKKKTIREAKKLLEGKADGEMVIEGHKKHLTGGSHSVVEDINKPEVAFKETIEGHICQECNTHNPENAKFCINCGKEIRR
jgi:ribosomal protein L40E